MKEFLRNLALGLLLAVGALATLLSVILMLDGGTEGTILAIVVGLIGIPVLFAALVRISERRATAPQ